jgi:hypothetical protein
MQSLWTGRGLVANVKIWVVLMGLLEVLQIGSVCANSVFRDFELDGCRWTAKMLQKQHASGMISRN